MWLVENMLQSNNCVLDILFQQLVVNHHEVIHVKHKHASLQILFFLGLFPECMYHDRLFVQLLIYRDKHILTRWQVNKTIMMFDSNWKPAYVHMMYVNDNMRYPSQYLTHAYS